MHPSATRAFPARQTLLAGWALFLVVSLAPASARGAGEGPHADDPDIVARLAELGDGTSALLPPVRVRPAGELPYGQGRVGPGQRDYCNKMPYAPERRTALYAGGNHASPHRMNDVWEYHLGSNTWHRLYAPDGGNAGRHKAAYFLTSRTLVRKPDTPLTDKQKQQIADYKEWWTKHAAFRDGHLATTRGGPIMPAHTWDAFAYDARAKKLLWGMGVSPAAQWSTHARFTGTSVDEWTAKADRSYTPMWTFDPEKKKWTHYRTEGKVAELRGMGATMAYLPDVGRTLWYVAAQNVSPHAYEMWLFDAVADRWTELKPNGGKSIAELATRDKVAPLSEQQTAYSARHGKLVAVRHHDTFVYDVKANRWSKAVTDGRIYGHDARSVFAYDSRAGVFLLAFVPEGRGKQLKLAAFSLETNKWEILTPEGPAVPPTRYGSYMGYYDPDHNAFVVQGRSNARMWVYRHRKGEK